MGLVSDNGEGEGKRRLWQAATDFHTWEASDFAGDEDSETALGWLVRDYARHFAAAVRAVARRRRRPGRSTGATPRG